MPDETQVALLLDAVRKEPADRVIALMPQIGQDISRRLVEMVACFRTLCHDFFFLYVVAY